ncbi:hypothetical protein EOL96_00240 [Candidatus Saccharibacteria bacterium]|nr:hypothetical protein [Candidatus Saccharibacteria bacterium]
MDKNKEIREQETAGFVDQQVGIDESQSPHALGPDHESTVFSLGEHSTDVNNEQYITKANQERTVDEIMSVIRGVQSHEQVILTANDARLLIESGRPSTVASLLGRFSGLDAETARLLIESRRASDVASGLDKFSDLDAEIAHLLIQAGEAFNVASNLDKFSGLDHNEIARLMIETGQPNAVAFNLEKFNGLDHNEIARLIIGSAVPDTLLHNLEKFNGLDYNEIVYLLIEVGQTYAVAGSLDKFSNLDAEIARLLIQAGEGHMVSRYMDKFSNLDAEIARLLIQAGEAHMVVGSLDEFSDLDAETAQMLIKEGWAFRVVNNFDKFNNLNYNEIARLMIETDQASSVAEHLDKFTGINHGETARLMIGSGQAYYVAVYLDKFSNIDRNEFARLAIGAGQAAAIADCLEKFSDFDHKEIARLMIESGQTYAIARNFDKFSGLDAETARLMIEAGQSAVVSKNLDKFSGLDAEIAHLLFKTGQVFELANNLDKFIGLDAEVAHLLIQAGRASAVAGRLEKFSGLNTETAHLLIQVGSGYDVARNLDKFVGLDHKEAARLIIQSSQAYAVTEYFDKFIGLDHKETARLMIETKQAFELAVMLEIFSGLDAEIAYLMVVENQADAVAANLEIFSGIDHKQIVRLMIGADQAYAVATNLEKFSGLDHKQIARLIIESGQTSSVAGSLDKFSDLDAEIARLMIEAGAAYAVSMYLDKFSGLDHNEIARLIIESDQAYAVAIYLVKFNDLDTTIAANLIVNGCALEVIQHPGAFGAHMPYIVMNNLPRISSNENASSLVIENLESYCLSPEQSYTLLTNISKVQYSVAQKIAKLDLESIVGDERAKELRALIASLKPELKGVLKTDPYSETAGDMEHVTSSMPGTTFHAEAVRISRELRHPKSPEYEVYATEIKSSYESLKQRIIGLHGKEYADSLFGERGDGTGDTWPTYRRLVADYLAMPSTTIDLADVLQSANSSFEQVLRVDVDYYDKIFAEWDAKRIGSRDFQEVFLGRDGVYAYVGRRAQLFARRRKLGLRSDAIFDFPTYLNYPRGFKDGLDDTTKQVYLENKINPGGAHYFDTGFNGSIPEDIMRVLGVSIEEWDARIRLLSSSLRDRTVLGLRGTKDERDQVVHTVEGHVKDVESAEGLYIAESGSLEPYAKPKSAGERLAFRFSQLALHRHYYTQEMQRAGGSTWNTNALPGGRILRIDTSHGSEMTHMMTDLFSSPDVGRELMRSAHTLKIANPDDPYPDEAVFELPGGVIVKSVVPEKQNGPIDEFEALVLLKQIGIEAPMPVARVFTEGKNGFIAMEKLSGISGRSIKSYFVEHNISVDDQKLVLNDALQRMRDIAEQTRRVAGLDKPWRLKDFMIKFGMDDNFGMDDKGNLIIETMRPIDFERAGVFNPGQPNDIKLGQGLDELVSN